MRGRVHVLDLPRFCGPPMLRSPPVSTRHRGSRHRNRRSRAAANQPLELSDQSHGRPRWPHRSNSGETTVMISGTVIVGTGQAGFQTAASLRTEGYQEKITLIAEDPHIPYQRPPLSKSFPLGAHDVESIELRPKRFYQDHQNNLIDDERDSSI